MTASVYIKFSSGLIGSLFPFLSASFEGFQSDAERILIVFLLQLFCCYTVTENKRAITHWVKACSELAIKAIEKRYSEWWR